MFTYKDIRMEKWPFGGIEMKIMTIIYMEVIYRETNKFTYKAIGKERWKGLHIEQ